jgi:hypothetical protein
VGASWLSLRERLLRDLDAFEARFMALIDASTIKYVNPNTWDSPLVFLSAADWGWGPSDDVQMRLRIELTRLHDDWCARSSSLLVGAIPELAETVREAHDFVTRWLRRDGWDHDVPRTTAEAKSVAARKIAPLREALEVLGGMGATGVHVVPDTSALLDNPDLAAYAGPIGADAFTVHLLPQVLAELDDKKESARTPEIRDRARTVIRRIKGLRDHGDLSTGVALTKTIRVMAEARDPRFRSLPDWLDPTVPDDRVIAGALELQGQHPSAAVVLVASDINIQNKAHFAGLPFVEPPDAP